MPKRLVVRQSLRCNPSLLIGNVVMYARGTTLPVPRRLHPMLLDTALTREISTDRTCDLRFGGHPHETPTCWKLNPPQGVDELTCRNIRRRAPRHTYDPQCCPTLQGIA